MTPERRQKIKDVIARAFELSVLDRPSFLAQACGDDETLLTEVNTALAVEETPTVLVQGSHAARKRRGSFALGDSLLNGRFLLLELLGSGSVGTVYLALDRERNEKVALKVLHSSEPDLVARFKNEFRSLQGTHHPNLVRIDEMFEVEETCFFSMELVEGPNFLEYVRTSAPVSAVYNPDRLLPSLLQLCEGISALHHAGKLHRDIKPANVLVGPDGRVVLLDFSVGRELDAGTERQTLVGTPPYMAPEQVLQLPTVSKAADWFGVGVMLYEALTGGLPFEGDYWRWATDESQNNLIHPRALKPGIPQPLAELCMDLLARAPEHRPTADDIFRRLGMIGGAVAAPPPAPSGELFVGREPELLALGQLFETTRTGHAAIADLFGRSGMGKSTLVQKFLRELSEEHPDAVILTGRCHPSEMVPFKALDEIIGRLSRVLKNLPNSEAEAVVSRDVHLVARLFPALRQVPAIALSERKGMEITDSQEFRKRAFISLLDLLGRLASRRPLVIAIDDLQWGDLDSAVFFREFVSSLSPVNLLLIASYRSEDLESSPFLKETRRYLSAVNPQIAIERIEVRELPPDESARLAISLLTKIAITPQRQAMTIAQESLGSPFLIEQFARHVVAEQSHSLQPSTAADYIFDLREVTEARIASLPEAARRLLRIVSVAGQPISERLARTTTGLTSEYFLALTRLCSERLLRVRDSFGVHEIEVYHDQIREIVNASFAIEDRKEQHRQIALALQEIDSGDPAAVLATHFQQAEMYDEAAGFAIKAAENAFRTLAFERAAQFYRQALSLRVHDNTLVCALKRKLGDALVASGRGVEAAEAYTVSAESEGSPSRRIECLRLAADQYLRSGHIVQGIDVLRTLAASVGIRITEKKWRIVLLILFRRAHLKLRGLGYHERGETEIPPEALWRLDVYWSLVIGLITVDTRLGVAFHARHLLLALRTGEPYRIGLSLALEAVVITLVRGEEEYPRAQEILRECAALGLRLNSPYLLGLTSMTGAACAFFSGRFRDAKQLAAQAEEILRSQCTGVAWELAEARSYYFVALSSLGEWGELSEKLPAALKDAQERNDLHAVTQLILCTPSHLASLSADKPDEAYQGVTAALANWSKTTQRSFDIPHFFSVAQLSSVLLYKNLGEQAWALIDREWTWIRRLLFQLRAGYLVVLAYQLRGNAALAVASATSGEKQRILLAEAERCATRMEQRKIAWTIPHATAIRASIEATSGRRSKSLRLLATAEAELELSSSRIAAAAMRYRRGSLIGGKEGRNLQDSAVAFMESQGIVKPQCIVEMLAPGKWQQGSD